MKMMPTHELIEILSRMSSKLISKDTIENLFEVYGDDYFKDYGASPWELTNKNEERRSYLYGNR